MFHLVMCKLCLFFFKGIIYCIGTTYLVQPLDVVINAPFKKLIEDQSCQHLQENLDLYNYEWQGILTYIKTLIPSITMVFVIEFSK